MNELASLQTTAQREMTCLQPKKIGFIGIGAMGRPMAANLLKAGFSVTVYNRTAERTRELAQQGAAVAASPAKLASQVDLLITMVSDDGALEEVVLGQDGILAGPASQGASQGQSGAPGRSLIHVDMSTVSPETSRRVAALESEKGVAFLDAPVSGSIKPATEGTLTIMVGGDEEAFAAAKPVLAAMGNRIFHLGPTGSGHTMKLVVNLLLGVEMQVFSEALVLGEGLGLKRNAMIEVITGSAVGSPLMGLKAPVFSQRIYPPAFALKHMAKDLRLALIAATKAGLPLPTGSTVQMLFAAALAQGYGDEDVAAIDRLMLSLAHLS